MRKYLCLLLLFICLPALAQKIPEKIFGRMQGNSWKQNNAVSKDELTYLRFNYWGFDDKVHLGEIIVHKTVAKDVTEIFAQLFKTKFPIEKIRLIDDYQGNDDLSMADNNSSAFCTRPKTGKSGGFSKHSYGIAIDINPVQNPYVKDSTVSPSAGKEFLDRNNIRKGMIVKNDACYKAFTKRGWQWGGDWETLKDYQHFEKT